MVVFLLSFYFSCLLQFSLISHPIVYCFLLLLCSLSGAGICYSVLGFSWYMALLCLVYIGGVYVLFIFVSVHNPNPSSSLGSGSLFFLFSWLFFFSVFSFFDLSGPIYVESSHLLCSYFEGFSYCLLCVILLLGFVIISVVSSDKGSFYR